jgi:hypothetical protein
VCEAECRPKSGSNGESGQVRERVAIQETYYGVKLGIRKNKCNKTGGFLHQIGVH